MSFVLATMADKQARHYLRQGSTSKKPLKEKLVQIYEAYFRGEDPSLGNPGFWDELFLLKVNANFIESELEKLSADQLHGLKENINTLFYKCVATLREDYQIRIVHALQTLCALIRGVYRRDLANYGFDVIDVLVGFDSAENLMQTLIEHVNSFLVTECPVGLRSLSLKLLLALATATDNVSQNTILEYLMMNSIFESIIHLLANPTDRQHHGEDIVLLLAILVNYRKYESANPYIVKLSILDDELALNGLGQVVSNILSDFNREFAMRQPDQQQQGFFSTITSMVGGMLLAEENGNGGQSHLVRANHGILLALYEAVHLNRNFVTALTHSHTIMETSPPHSPVALNPPLDLSTESQSSNLLVTFLQYSSIVFQDVKDESKQCNAKLCLIIMTCIAEDQYANSLMHDANMNFRVQLHKMPMRHRKPKPEKAVPSRPLACALLDLMVEFVMSHMMKNLPMELYLKCLGITHRVLCYQKRCRVRLNYTWKELWTALISLLKFLLAQESSLLPQYNIFQLASQVVNIFNLFITYGDTFLPSPTSYDELYYEVVRMHQVFDNLYSMALRYTSTEGEYKEVASRLTNSLVNIRAIINHFNPKIDSWAAVNHLSALTEEQVLEVVRGNYDTLTLKLHDSLDLFERYSEKPKESSFFTQLVRSVIQDVRTHVATTAVTQERVLQEFSSIS